jgi:hypothetical protein
VIIQNSEEAGEEESSPQPDPTPHSNDEKDFKMLEH